MKIKQLILIIFLIFLGCQKETLIDEIPDNISYVTPAENLVDSLLIFLPPGGDVLLRNPEFFSDTVQKHIVLTKKSKVYVTFIDEGAGYRNSLFWYSYNISQPPVKVSDIKGEVLFPNISKKGEGGQLEAGWTVQVGTKEFPANTVIGFFLIERGWENGTINYNNPTHYTNYNFNNSGIQQHVMFKNKYSKNIVIGFEDISIVDVNSMDRDYNDILFAVTDNKMGIEATSFDLSKIILK